MAKYSKLVAWGFNTDLFSRSIVSLSDSFTIAEIAELVGVTPSCIKAWSRGHYSDGFEHPSMSNFLIVCDELDMDPREFFSQEDVQ